MSWAARRRTLFLTIFFIVVGFGAAALGIATLYQTPTCSDAKQNQDELGVDCGGSCARLCAFEARDPVIKFVRAIKAASDRTDVIAYVDNQNVGAAAHAAPYRLDLYGSDNILVASVTGSLELPPSTTVPVFAAGVFSGSHTVARAFLTFPETLSWERYTDERPRLSVSEISITDSAIAPRVTVSIGNPTFSPLFNIPVVAAVFDEAGNAIAASRTILERLPPQSSAQAVFTWRIPFSSKGVRVDITPQVPL